MGGAGGIHHRTCMFVLVGIETNQFRLVCIGLYWLANTYQYKKSVLAEPLLGLGMYCVLVCIGMYCVYWHVLGMYWYIFVLVCIVCIVCIGVYWLYWLYCLYCLYCLDWFVLSVLLGLYVLYVLVCICPDWYVLLVLNISVCIGDVLYVLVWIGMYCLYYNGINNKW